MQSTREEQLALQDASELEMPLGALEARLSALANALRERDPAGIEHEARLLHQALTAAMERFGAALQAGPLPPPLRARLIAAGGQVAAQREALARATASLDRAIDVLMPGAPTRVYAPTGIASAPVASGLHAE